MFFSDTIVFHIYIASASQKPDVIVTIHIS